MVDLAVAGGEGGDVEGLGQAVLLMMRKAVFQAGGL